MSMFIKHGPAALKRGLKILWLGGDVAVSASEAFLSRFRASDENNFQEKKMGGPFAYRDADQFGAARYNIEQTRGNDEVVDAQFALAKSGHLKFSDIDGGVGNGTLAAISAYEEAEGVNFYTGELLEADDDPPASQPEEDETFMISPRLKHTSQAAADVGDIEIPGKDAKGRPLNRPVSQIGCLSCAMVSVRDYYSESDIDFPTGI